MTYPEFRELLRQTPGPWRLMEPGGAIRAWALPCYRCPIEAAADSYAAGDRDYSPNLDQAVELLDLENSLSSAIAHAADGCTYSASIERHLLLVQIRKDLLEDCKLTEVAS